MKNFLEQPDACFYHVTTAENWALIKKEGLKARRKKIFLLNSCTILVVASLCADQLREKIENSSHLVILKLPQSLNNFRFEEIMKDNQANVEMNKIFQNFISRDRIPLEHIELVGLLETSLFLKELDILAALANTRLKNTEIGGNALALKYYVEHDPIADMWPEPE